jgi:hypothetical protein
VLRWRNGMDSGHLDPKKIYRFDRSANRYHIDIAIDYYRDVYNEWDFAPFRNRDLDRSFMEYLEECSREIPLRAGVAITFFMPRDIYDAGKEERSIAGLKNYFRYELLKARGRRRRYYRRFALYFLFGVAFLAGAYGARRLIGGPFPRNVLPEGLVIGGWVLFWEAFTIIFFRSRDVTERIGHLRRFVGARIAYVYKDRADLARGT